MLNDLSSLTNLTTQNSLRSWASYGILIRMSQPEAIIDTWLYPDTNGDIYIIDPATQEAPEGGIPQFVRRDKRLGQGLQAFARFPVSTEIAFGEHQYATDLDMPDDETWYERATSDPTLDVYAYEGLYNMPGLDFLARARGGIRQGSKPRDFTARFVRALSQTTAISGSFDPGLADRKERIALWLDRATEKDKYNAYHGSYEGPNLVLTQRYVAAFMVSQIVREGIMSAKMGLLINRAAKRRTIEDVDDPYHQLVTVGATHRRQEQLMRDLGAQVTVRELPLSEQGTEQVAYFYNILRKGVISPEDVQRQQEVISAQMQAAKEQLKKKK